MSFLRFLYFKSTFLSCFYWQSFPHKSTRTPRDPGCLTDGEIGCNNSSRMELKWGHQWFMDVGGPDLFTNNKQAVEALNGRQVSRVPQMNFFFHGITLLDSSLFQGSSLIAYLYLSLYGLSILLIEVFIPLKVEVWIWE